MTDQRDPIPGVIIAGTALYSGAKIGIAVGVLICPAAAVLIGYVGALGAQHLAMRRFEETKTPYADAGRALFSLGIHMLPDTPPDLTVLTDPLPDVSGLPEASPLPAPAAARRPSLLERITADRQETAPA